MKKRTMVGPWHWGDDGPGMPSSETLGMTGEKPQNWVTSEDMGLGPKDKEVLVHPPGSLNSVLGVRCV